MSGRHRGDDQQSGPETVFELIEPGGGEGTVYTLIASGVRYDVGGTNVLREVDITARAGRLLGVRGPSGAGKSTLLAILAGLLAPSAGVITLDGLPVGVHDARYRARVGIVLQSFGLVSALTARENVAIALQARGLPRDEIRERTTAALASVDLDGAGEHLTDDLSGGQRQRIALARALAIDPDVLFADEPSAQLDHDNRAHVVELLVERAARGAIVVIATHDPTVIEHCDDVVTLDAGTVVR
jgi:putative ABC transport system ATP-binding protein